MQDLQGDLAALAVARRPSQRDGGPASAGRIDCRLQRGVPLGNGRRSSQPRTSRRAIAL